MIKPIIHITYDDCEKLRTLSVQDIFNNVLDPFMFFDICNFRVKHPKSVDIDPKYYNYFSKYLGSKKSFKQWRLRSNFVYSIPSFYTLKTVDLFPFDDWSPIYKISCANKLQTMYTTYFKLLSDNCFSYNTVVLYILCCLLRKKINIYSKFGEQACDEIMHYDLETLCKYIDDFCGANNTLNRVNDSQQLSLSNLDQQAQNLNLILCYHLLIDNKAYIYRLLQYVKKLDDSILYNNNYIGLIDLYNYLAKFDIIDKEYEQKLLTFILNHIGKQEDLVVKQATCLRFIRYFNAKTYIADEISSYKQSLQLIEKLE